MIYVDDLAFPYGRMIMYHMFGDTLEELHEMADAIGVDRRWFQNKPGFPHYDVSKSRRARAVLLGATEVTAKELVAIVRERYPRT